VTSPVAELDAVTHRYGAVAALTDVSFSLNAGEVTALLGPNGAGKTTTVGLLTGLLRPGDGAARLFGGDPRSLPARRRIGVMLQGSKVPETMTVHLAKVAMSATFGLIIIALMGLCGALLGGVRLSAGEWAGLAAVLVLGAVPFCLIGLAIGLAVSPAAAPGIVNLIHLPLAFLSGLALPVEAMPAAIRTLAQALPQYHLGQLALGAIGYARQPDPMTHVLVLAATTVVAAVVAARAYRRQ